MWNPSVLSPAEEEVDVDVRREDQKQICEFGNLNARLAELQDDEKALKKKLETYEDAEAEASLVIGEDDEVCFMAMRGECFVQCDEDAVNERLEEMTEAAKAELDACKAQMAEVSAKMDTLKKALYGRFGKSINLEA